LCFVLWALGFGLWALGFVLCALCFDLLRVQSLSLAVKVQSTKYKDQRPKA